MKSCEHHFIDYVKDVSNNTLHPKIKTFSDKLPDDLTDINNLILYGPSGVGKYSQALYIINKYSISRLKYEKKIILQLFKQTFNIKVSDIHYEVDMELLGCNSKNNWNDIYNHIVNIIDSSKKQKGIILCKNFQNIHNELLDIFYSYMQNNSNIRFIILTTEMSFIPYIILNKCLRVNVSMYSKCLIKKCLKCKGTSSNNINYLKNDCLELDNLYISSYNKLLNIIKNYNSLNYGEFREIIYNILIYKNDINDLIWYILKDLIKNNILKEEKIGDILLKTTNFFQLYNNNYRPIYHLEDYFYYLIIAIHELQ